MTSIRLSPTRALCGFLAALVLAGLPTLAFAKEDGWQLRKDKDGIQVYSRPVEGWTIHEVRAVTRIPSKLSSIIAVIDDVPNLPKLVTIVDKAELFHRDSPTKYQVYTTIKMPWPVSNRDALNQREIQQDATTHVVTITDKALAEGKPVEKDKVRIVKSTQIWTLTPGADGTVEVQTRMLSDPNGPIPSGIINAMSVGAPYDTLENLRKLSADPKYANASLPFIQEPQK
ncbi:MAG TPA: START domain-containing protein [Nevskiaceae bacterium]|nr:START domain-containing protein [Nevskiaceae bacterium]